MRFIVRLITLWVYIYYILYTHTLVGVVPTPHIFNATLRAINFTTLSDISPHCDNSWRKKYHTYAYIKWNRNIFVVFLMWFRGWFFVRKLIISLCVYVNVGLNIFECRYNSYCFFIALVTLMWLWYKKKLDVFWNSLYK